MNMHAPENRLPSGTPMTMVWVNLVKGLGPVLLLTEGYSVDVPNQFYYITNQRTHPTWPMSWLVPRLNGQGAFRDVHSVMANWDAKHGAIGYGHIGADQIIRTGLRQVPYACFLTHKRISTWRKYPTLSTTISSAPPI